MDISYNGGNSVTIIAKQGSVVVDSTISLLGLKNITVKDGIYIYTQQAFIDGDIDGVIVEGPGEYEIKNVSIKAVPAHRMIDSDDALNSTMYRLVLAGTSIAIVGHVSAPLSEEQLEALGVIDIAIIPVGGSGYTLDAHQAVSIVRQLDPKIVIPTHYAEKGLKYEVDQMDLEPFVHELSAPHEVTPRLKIKNGVLPETMTLFEITRS